MSQQLDLLHCQVAPKASWASSAFSVANTDTMAHPLATKWFFPLLSSFVKQKHLEKGKCRLQNLPTNVSIPLVFPSTVFMFHRCVLKNNGLIMFRNNSWLRGAKNSWLLVQELMFIGIARMCSWYCLCGKFIRKIWLAG